MILQTEEKKTDIPSPIDFHIHPWSAPSQFMGMYPQAVLGEHISDEAKALILRENAARLLRISEA